MKNFELINSVMNSTMSKEEMVEIRKKGWKWVNKDVANIQDKWIAAMTLAHNWIDMRLLETGFDDGLGKTDVMTTLAIWYAMEFGLQIGYLRAVAEQQGMIKKKGVPVPDVLLKEIENHPEDIIIEGDTK